MNIINILGSLEFFSDEFFQAEVQTGNGKPVASGNFELAEALSLWCFKVVEIHILNGYIGLLYVVYMKPTHFFKITYSIEMRRQVW